MTAPLVVMPCNLSTQRHKQPRSGHNIRKPVSRPSQKGHSEQDTDHWPRKRFVTPQA